MTSTYVISLILTAIIVFLISVLIRTLIMTMFNKGQDVPFKNAYKFSIHITGLFVCFSLLVPFGWLYYLVGMPVATVVYTIINAYFLKDNNLLDFTAGLFAASWSVMFAIVVYLIQVFSD